MLSYPQDYYLLVKARRVAMETGLRGTSRSIVAPRYVVCLIWGDHSHCVYRRIGWQQSPIKHGVGPDYEAESVEEIGRTYNCINGRSATRRQRVAPVWLKLAGLVSVAACSFFPLLSARTCFLRYPTSTTASYFYRSFHLVFRSTDSPYRLPLCL